MPKKDKAVIQKPSLVSINAYSRSKGIDAKTMRQSLKRVGLRGRVDPSVADPLLAVAIPSRNKNEERGSEESYSEAERRLKWAKATQEELKLQKLQGTLVSRDAVACAIFEGYRAARDKLFNIPARVSGILAAETDQEAIHRMLTNEIHTILTELSHGLKENT